MRLLSWIGIPRFECESLFHIGLVADKIEAHEALDLVIVTHAVHQVPSKFALSVIHWV